MNKNLISYFAKTLLKQILQTKLTRKYFIRYLILNLITKIYLNKLLYEQNKSKFKYFMI